MPQSSFWRMGGPFRANVSQELIRLERLFYRVWQILALAGVITGVIYAIAVSRALGLGCAIGAAAFLVWFVLIGHLSDRGQAPPAMLLANTVVEGLIPWVFLLVIVFTKGADYALASWVPPFLFCSCLVGYVPRLDPVKPAVYGALGALIYPALYFALLRDRLSPEAAELLINQPATQISRSVTLFISSFIGVLLIVGLRRVIGIAAGDGSEQVLGRYRRVRPLAEGVYEGTAQSPGGADRRVLIEALLPPDPKALGERASAALRVVHPGVVQLLDFGVEGQQHLMVSEYVDGLLLGDLMQRAFRAQTALPPEVVAHLGLELLAALDHVHRGALDVEGQPLGLICAFDPDDAIVSSLGEIKLRDVWRPLSLRARRRWPTAQAPELAQRAPVSEQTDIYALGVTLWELLAGEARLPEYAGVPLTRRNPALDRGWDALFLRVLAPDPALRPQSAREMAIDLERLRTVNPPTARDWLSKLVENVRASAG